MFNTGAFCCPNLGLFLGNLKSLGALQNKQEIFFGIFFYIDCHQ